MMIFGAVAVVSSYQNLEPRIGERVSDVGMHEILRHHQYAVIALRGNVTV
jgi:hypothetical protein